VRRSVAVSSHLAQSFDIGSILGPPGDFLGSNQILRRQVVGWYVAIVSIDAAFPHLIEARDAIE